MHILGYNIQEEIQAKNPYQCFRAQSDTDNSPTLIKVSSENYPRSNEYEIFKKDHVMSLSLSNNCRHVLKPIEFNHASNFTYLTYEYFHGIPLSEILAQNSLDIETVLLIANELCESLSEIHQQNIIHKNLNPNNILVDPDNYEIKLMDFRNASEQNLKSETFNLINGEINLSYISPELTGRLESSIDHRSDYYSLGVILYEMLTGSTPFESTDAMEMIHSHIARLPKSPSIHTSRCPQALSDLVLKLLSKMPSDRYQSSIGIQYDINHCLQHLEKNSKLLPFPLAENDFSTHFSLPNIFYGRHHELEQLDNVFKNVSNENKSIITVQGEMGVGKSTLVDEWERRITLEAHYVEGKFWQFKNNSPYSAFIQIIEVLTKYLLSEPEVEFTKYQADLNESLSGNAGIITNLVPMFESIIGKQSVPITLSPIESGNRFRDAISSLLSVFSCKNKPLIIFIDDLQWADEASLLLLESLIDTEWAKNTMLIFGFRDNELDVSHILKTLLNKLKLKKTTSEIKLDNLSIDLVSNLVAQTLKSDVESIISLSSYLYSVTQGNVFYIKQLINNMYQDGLIWADEEAQKWCWDISQKENDIDIDNHNHNLPRLMDAMISRLTPEELKLLKYGFCMGNNFRISELAYVMNETDKDIIYKIMPLINQGFIYISADNIYFRHDGIQKSVVINSTEEELKEINFNIGQHFLDRYQDELTGERLLSVTDHLNISESFLGNIEQRDKLLDLNYRSTKHALLNCAYLLALEYSLCAERLLKKVSSQIYNKFHFDIKLNTVRCLYLNAQHNEARNEISIIFNESKTLKQKSECYRIFKDILVSEESGFNEAVRLGLDILNYAGINASEDNESLLILIQEKRSRIDTLMQGKSASELLDYPLLNDEDKIYLLGVLIDLWEAAYYDANEGLMQYSILCAVVISLEDGNASESAFAYVLYGMMLTLEGKYQDAYNFGDMSIKLNEKFGDKVMLPKVTNLFCNYINFHLQPYESSVKLYTKSSETGQQNGDYLFGLWATFFIIWSRFLANDNLLDVLIISDKVKGFIEQTDDTKMIYAHRLLENVVGALRGEDGAGNVVSLNNNAGSIEYWQQNGFLPGIAWHAILVGQYYCILGDYEKAYALLAQKDMATSASLIMFPYAQYIFYKTLAILKLINSGQYSLTMEYEKNINDNISLITTWADHCPENFLSQQFMLQAEKNRMDSMLWEASILYSKAIESGTEYNGLCDIALSHELAADFQSEHGDVQLKHYHLRCAASYYETWGAFYKSSLLFASLEQEPYKINDYKRVYSTKNKIESSSLINDTSELDLYSVFKFTQAISEEIHEEELVSKSIEILLENVGADKGALISVVDKELIVNVIAEYKDNEIVTTNLKTSLDSIIYLPKGIIHYVQRSKNELVLDLIDFSENHQDTEYIELNRVKCLSCLPVLHKEKLIAILYLENKSTTGIFNDDRTQILKIFLSQMAISLQNAALYKSLNQEINRHEETANSLKSSEERLRLSNLYSNVGIWDWNISTNELYWNEMIAPMFGGAGVELDISYDSFMNAVHPDDRHLVNDAIQDCFNGAMYQVEHRVVWQDGTVRWVRESGDVMRDDKGKPVRMLGIVNDITRNKEEDQERNTLEKQLQQAQKMEAIGQLTGGIAHDFNNMLAAILGYAELLEYQTNSENPDKSSISKSIKTITSSGKRAASLVAQMLAYSRTSKIETDNIDLVAVVNETMNMLMSMLPATIKINFNHKNSIPIINANSTQLNQIILNLCINARDARDALDEHGEINISISHVKSLKGLCSSCFSPFVGDFVELSIRDNAGGISDEIVETIFNPFFTTKEPGKGSGMGLSMVHGIVHSHKGHIILDRIKGKGSNFRILFPILKLKNESLTKIPQTKQNINTIHNYRVLVVDDEPSIADMINIALSEQGYKVTVCIDSNEALRLINRNIDDFDIMITDQTMPDVTGADLSTAALKINPDFPIILCSGYSATLNEESAKNIGIQRMMKKPLSLVELDEVIKEILA